MQSLIKQDPDQVEIEAINVLEQYSSYERKIDWAQQQKRKYRQKKRRRSQVDITKPVKLPLLLKKKTIQENNQNFLVCRRSKEMNKVYMKGFFQYGPLHAEKKKEEVENLNQKEEKRKKKEVSMIKQWLKEKQIQCKSLNNLITKFKRVVQEGQVFSRSPFTIKSINNLNS